MKAAADPKPSSSPDPCSKPNLGEQADGERRVRIAQREEPVQRPVLARVRGDIGEI